jgi:hypothetical protein
MTDEPNDPLSQFAELQKRAQKALQPSAALMADWQRAFQPSVALMAEWQKAFQPSAPLMAEWQKTLQSYAALLEQWQKTLQPTAALMTEWQKTLQVSAALVEQWQKTLQTLCCTNGGVAEDFAFLCRAGGAVAEVVSRANEGVAKASTRVIPQQEGRIVGVGSGVRPFQPAGTPILAFKIAISAPLTSLNHDYVKDSKAPKRALAPLCRQGYTCGQSRQHGGFKSSDNRFSWGQHSLGSNFGALVSMPQVIQHKARDCRASIIPTAPSRPVSCPISRSRRRP